MVTNGNNDPAEVYRRHFLSVDSYRRRAGEAGQTASRLRAEAERLAALADDWESKRSDLEARAVQAGAVEGGLRRSKMSAAEISKFIRSYPGGPAAGAAAFRELPK
jgi:hypothetical protein